MTMEQLSYFYEVAKCLNFSEAARRLYISQPNLTKYIANLEKELGFRLFDRSTRHCQLTEEGTTFLRNTEPLFNQLNNLINDSKMRAERSYHFINLGLVRDEMPPRDFMRCLNEENASPDHRFLVREEDYLSLITMLRERLLDLVVTTDKNIRSMEEDFNYLTLRPFHMLMVVHNSNPKSRLKALTPRDCAQELLFMSIPDGKNTPLNRVEEIHRRLGVSMTLGIMFSPADVLLNVQTGVGIGIVPSVMDFTQYYDLSYYQFESPHDSQQVLAWRKDEDRPDVLAFIQKIAALAPFDTPPEVPVHGLEE